MSGTITSVAQRQETSEPAGSTSGTGAIWPQETAPSAAPTPTTPGEAVTLSADAQTTTQLLDAARNAGGVDQGAVAKLQDAVQAGTYDVTPETLARAIAAALKEMPS